MMMRRLLVLTLISVTALTGCPPKENTRKEVIRVGGRTGLSPTGSQNANGTISSLNSSNSTTLWGGVSAIDNFFAQNVKLLAKPSLDGAPQEEQLGLVSPQPGPTGGIFFWANIIMGPGGQVDSAKSKIHLEIFDSNYNTLRADGTPIEQLFLHIGPEQAGFIGVQGNPNQVIFQSEAFSIKLVGSNQGGNYVGTMSFLNAFTNGQYYTLGQFTVPYNGIFTSF
jgi:hypothetical protein